VATDIIFKPHPWRAVVVVADPLSRQPRGLLTATEAVDSD
jgi:hypothetical protein